MSKISLNLIIASKSYFSSNTIFSNRIAVGKKTLDKFWHNLKLSADENQTLTVNDTDKNKLSEHFKIVMFIFAVLNTYNNYNYKQLSLF